MYKIARSLSAACLVIVLLAMAMLSGCDTTNVPPASTPESSENAVSDSAESVESAVDGSSAPVESDTVSALTSDVTGLVSGGTTAVTKAPTTVTQAIVVDGKANPLTPDSERWMGGYSVKDFGAKGDGKTDDLPAFQAALAAAKTANSCAVFVPKGTYYLSDFLVLGEGITLYGAYTENVAKSENALPVLKFASEALFGLMVPKGGAIIGLHIQCAADDSSITSAIYAYSPGCRIENCLISDAHTGILYEQEESNPGRGQIINVLIRRPRHIGAYVQDTYDFTYLEKVQVLGGDALKNSGTGFIFGKNDAVRVQDCTVDGADVGFLFNDDEAGKSSWGTFTRLSATDVNTAVRYESVSDTVSMQPTTISNSRFTAKKAGVEITLGCRSLTSFSDCTFTVSDGPVFSLMGSGSVTVRGCTLTTSSKTAVDILNCENAVFTSNTVSAGEVGFKIASFTPNGLVITGNTINAATKIDDASPAGEHKALQ